MHMHTETYYATHTQAKKKKREGGKEADIVCWKVWVWRVQAIAVSDYSLLHSFSHGSKSLR